MASLAFFLLTMNLLVSASAYISPCGDGYCSTDLGEDNIESHYYCPEDCGGTREPTCPACPTCNYQTCDTSRVPVPDLTGWCNSNGYSSGASGGTGTSDLTKNYWWIFLIIGGVIGYYYKKK